MAVLIQGEPLRERLTNQIVHPLDWSEEEGTVLVYLNGERVQLEVEELETLDGESCRVR